ncbi:MAG: hypothetical protein DI585_00995 [Pseudomonas fluorescens]|nr:MAG: hypothetical protein DI585_00995 [Pseudomonas fluorescens]
MDVVNLPSYLKTTWDFLAKHSVDGVLGAIDFHAEQAGPTVGITIMTHGDEPAGLAAVHYFLQQKPLNQILRRGRVVFLINNLEASRRFWAAACLEDVRASRFVDVNMNRLPFADLQGRTYEEQRALEVLPVWRTFDYALDIHSTTQPTRPMVIVGRGPEAFKLCRTFDMDTVLENMLNVQLGMPAIAFYGHGATSTLGVEVGGHYSEQSLRRSVQTVVEFLEALDMIPALSQDLGYEREFSDAYSYYVYDALVLHHPEAELSRVFLDFENVRAGDVLARDPEREYCATEDGHVLFAPPQTRIMYPGEEALFLLKRRVKFERG